MTVIDSKKKKFTRFNEIKNDRTYSTKDELIAYLTNEVLDKRKNILKDVESDIVVAVKAKVEAVNDNLIKRPELPKPLALSGKIKSIYNDGEKIYFLTKNGIATLNQDQQRDFDFDLYVNSLHPDRNILMTQLLF